MIKNLSKNYLVNGAKWGINFQYKIQEKPAGLAQAFTIGKEFLGTSPSVLILGDNLFHGSSLNKTFNDGNNRIEGATVFAYAVKDPERYGVLDFNDDGLVIDIEEKPKNPKSNYAITGIYFFDNSVIEKSLKVKPSKEGSMRLPI